MKHIGLFIYNEFYDWSYLRKNDLLISILKLLGMNSLLLIDRYGGSLKELIVYAKWMFVK